MTGLEPLWVFLISITMQSGENVKFELEYKDQSRCLEERVEVIEGFNNGTFGSSVKSWEIGDCIVEHIENE